MDAARIEAWLLNEKDMHDSSLRTLPQSILRRPKPTISTICPDRDWTNPNRFSDPLNRASRLPNSLALTLPRTGSSKANSWYLDNHIPWRGNDPSKSWACWDDRVQSLFAAEGGDKNPVVNAIASNSDYGKRMIGHSGTSKTWERTRQTHTACPLRSNTATLETGAVLTLPTAAAGRLSFQMLSQRAGLQPFSRVRQCLGTHLTGATSSDANCSPASQRGRSPASSSSRSSISPQGTLNRLSPGMFHRHHHPQAASRLSPTSLLQPPSRITSPYSSTSRSSSPGFVSGWSGNSLSAISRQTSPFSSNASSSGGDMSVAGSETDDDFFYVSCHQLTEGLAGLSMASARPQHAGLCSPAACCSNRHSGVGGFRVVENPTFAYPGSGNYGDEEEEFDGCSDDALSDDVFLDNPEQPIDNEVTTKDIPERGTTETPSRLAKQQQGPAKGDVGVNSTKTSNNTTDNEEQGEVHKDTTERQEHMAAADSLRRNSLQSKMRRTWRQRRHIAAGHEVVTASNKSTKDDTPAMPSGKTSSQDPSKSKPPLCPSLACPASTEEDMPALEQPCEDKRCYYYVISPTDDDSMPDVIAVRKSSVELIRWQNSLRRRRRRQAKRHDLGRAKTREPKMSATV